MSDPALGLPMLGLIVVVIMMGFPTAFTLMGLGMFFGFHAFYDPSQHWIDNRIFDLMVQRTSGAMTNDVLISIPLFVLMGYVMERGALVDKMFYSIQLVVPAGAGIVGGGDPDRLHLLGYRQRSGRRGRRPDGRHRHEPDAARPATTCGLASGVITAGGTLGILIPPSVMIIVYAAVAGQSVVKLYASAMFPGFFLAFLYLVYIIGWAMLNPRIAPPLPAEQTQVPIPSWLRQFQSAYSPNMLVGLIRALFAPGRAAALQTETGPLHYGRLLVNFVTALVPLLLTAACSPWFGGMSLSIHRASVEEALPAGLEQLGTPLNSEPAKPVDRGPSTVFLVIFWLVSAAAAAMLARYYRRMDIERFEVVKLLTSSIMPLGILTVIVLAVILFGITTATESAAVGAAGAFLLALQARTLNWKRTKEAVFLTAKTTAMVCWLFVGSALFSAVFALLGGQALLRAGSCR